MWIDKSESCINNLLDEKYFINKDFFKNILKENKLLQYEKF